MRVLGLAGGLAVATTVVADGRVATKVPPPPAAVAVCAAPTQGLTFGPGEGCVSSVGPRSSRPRYTPAFGALDVRNVGPDPVAIAPAVAGSPYAPDRDLRLSIRSGARTLFAGTVGELRSGAARSLALEPGQAKQLNISASLPEDLVAKTRLPLRLALQWTTGSVEASK